MAEPAAWAIHGVGTLIAGGLGYWIGSKTSLYVYELCDKTPKHIENNILSKFIILKCKTKPVSRSNEKIL